MATWNVIHVVGTGTLGEPPIGLLLEYAGELGIDEGTFPRTTSGTAPR